MKDWLRTFRGVVCQFLRDSLTHSNQKLQRILKFQIFAKRISKMEIEKMFKTSKQEMPISTKNVLNELLFLPREWAIFRSTIPRNLYSSDAPVIHLRT